MQRRQLFEFNDAPWAPAALRETIVLALSQTIREGRLLDGAVGPFTRFLEQTSARTVLDVCSGGGDAAVMLQEALQRAGVTIELRVSDLFPQLEAWQALGVPFVEAPVDVTALPGELGAGSVCTIINALHHFPPAQAQQVLEGLCARARGVFVFEGLGRNFLSFAALAPQGVKSLAMTPLRAKARLASAALTWLTPIALLASVWDGSVSCLRTYEEHELRAMVAHLDGWHWEFVASSHGRFGQGSSFMGWPAHPGAASSERRGS